MEASAIRVLYVEDEAAMRIFLGRSFKKDGPVHISTASTAKEAIELINDAHESENMYDIVVLDWWVQDPVDLSMKTTKSVIRHIQDNRILTMMVVFTSDTTKNVNEDVTLGVPVIRKDFQLDLKRRIDEVAISKLNLLEAMKEIRSLTDRLRGLS